MSTDYKTIQQVWSPGFTPSFDGEGVAYLAIALLAKYDATSVTSPATANVYEDAIAKIGAALPTGLDGPFIREVIAVLKAKSNRVQQHL